MTDRELLEQIKATIDAHFAPRTLEVTSLADLQLAIAGEDGRRQICLRPGTYSGKILLDRPSDAPFLHILLQDCHITSNDITIEATPASGAVGFHGGDLTSTAPTRAIVQLGTGEETSLDAFPSYIGFYGTTIRGGEQQRRGIAAHGSHLFFDRIQVLDIKADGRDTQAIHVNGPGPVTILGSTLEASGENFMAGGQDPKIEGLVPADILIEQCTFRKPIEWRGTAWDVKNLLELKNARNVVVRDSTFENCWTADQTGYAILFKPTNQDGNASWSTVEDVLFERNVVRQVSSAFKLAPRDSAHPVAGIRRIEILNNSVSASRAAFGGDGRAMVVLNPIEALTVDGNTFECDGSTPIYLVGQARADSIWRNNTLPHNLYGFKAEGYASGSASLEEGAVWENMRVIGATASRYPAGTIVV
jgi:hypothetical protein